MKVSKSQARTKCLKYDQAYLKSNQLTQIKFLKVTESKNKQNIEHSQRKTKTCKNLPNIHCLIYSRNNTDAQKIIKY